MSTQNRQGELMQLTFAYPMPYEWSIGLYGSRFFQEIKEKRRFIGIKCNGCGMVYVPPRRVCGPCFKELSELVPLSDTGVITAFSVVNYPFIDPNTGLQRPIPYTYGYIRLDGADNIFSHIINETDLGRIHVGMKVRAVFKEPDRMQGNIQDIKYFDIIS
ncbi:MAG: Zn-ribbon domain-containing OB-fold protein [Deltaproteobacteria bacterium]|nr:Zn-ribbon domain-containing OB-fold protein [Deltaproteobacteria bacterium]